MSSYIKTVHVTVGRHDPPGNIDTILGDQIFVTFNAHSSCPDPAPVAATVACALQDALSNNYRQFRFVMGLAAGHAYIGSLGYQRFRNIVCMGGVMKLAGLLAHVRSSEQCAIITDAHMEGRLKYDFKLSPVDFVKFPMLKTYDASYGFPMVLYRVTGARTATKEDEWMYRVADVSGDDHVDEWTTTFTHIITESCPRTVKSLLQSYVHNHPSDAFANRLLDRMDMWIPRAGTVLFENPEGLSKCDGSSNSLKLLPSISLPSSYFASTSTLLAPANASFQHTGLGVPS
jgi:hypothetical protein